MPRSDWGIVVALVGCLILASLGLWNHQPPTNQPVQYQQGDASENASNSVSLTIGEGAKEDGGCQKGIDNRKSDLCAQWKAADAATSAAEYALSTLIISAIGTVLLIWTLRETRQTGRRELRAYITVDPGGVNEAVDGINRLPYNLTNCGQTPAHNLSIFGDIVVVEGNPRNFNPTTDGRLGDADASTDIVLGPNRNQWSYAYQSHDLFLPYLDKIETKQAAIVHYGFVEYRDVFRKIHRTYFAFYHWGEELSDDESKRCRFGNNAT
jgi:hypothetical protein